MLGRHPYAFLRRIAEGVLCLILHALVTVSARADAITDFYKGKDIKLIISTTVGGGYDIYARTVAKHLGGHIPGHPSIIPQNMPGAGGIAAANYMYNLAPNDGTVICLLQNTVALEPFYANKQAQFDAVKFSWLGTPTTEVAVYMVWHSSKIKTLQDAQTYEMMTGGAGILTGKACTIGRLSGHRTTVQPQGVFWPGYFRRMNSSP